MRIWRPFGPYNDLGLRYPWGDDIHVTSTRAILVSMRLAPWFLLFFLRLLFSPPVYLNARRPRNTQEGLIHHLKLLKTLLNGYLFDDANIWVIVYKSGY